MRLKPCPFCGSNDVQVVIYNRPSVVCQECWASGGAADYLTKENKDLVVQQAKDRWNKRINWHAYHPSE